MRKIYLLGTVFLLLLVGFFAWNNMFADNNLAKKPISPQAFDLSGGPEREKRGFPQREIIDLASEYPDVFFRQGSPKEKMVALTFDDGPDDNYTVEILDVLKKHKVPATFFLIGKRCELFPDVVKRMVKEKHVVGNHTWSHPDISKLSEKEIIEEITKADKVIKKIAGYAPRLFRSPYGSLGRKEVELISSKGYKIISWNVDSLDWKGLSAEEVKTNVLENVREGSIILQHSAGGIGEDLSGTVEALDEIIKVLKKDGYKFVTIDKLLDIPYKK